MTIVAERLAPGAHALRPVRMRGDDLVHYSATTFPKDPLRGCLLTLRRLEAFGHLAGVPGDKLENLWVDVLDAKGDILQEWPITRKGFEYLRRTLRFVIET